MTGVAGGASGGGTVAVVGGGAWGTALANAAALATGREVTLWMRDAHAAAEAAATRENARHLPGVRLDARVRPTGDPVVLADPALGAILLVTPAQSLRAVLEGLGPHLRPGVPLVLCAKGIEGGTGLSLSGVAREAAPPGAGMVAVLSGPSFAADVARGLPTAVTLACADPTLAERLAAALSGPSLRVYHTDDVVGVEVGGAGKNVLAIACGAVVGRGLGESARAALVARGFAELTRFARAAGARTSTLAGLSGLGDLVLTAASAHSRNFAFGARLGRGIPVAAAAGGTLVEGAHTAPALVALARAQGVEMPICEAVAGVVAGEVGIDAAIEGLMRRPLRAEDDAEAAPAGGDGAAAA